MSKLALAISIVIPGVGQFLSGRYGRGVGLFLLFQIFLGGMLYGLLGFPAEAGYSAATGGHVFWAFLLCLVIVWGYNASRLAAEAWGRSRRPEEKEAWFKEGLRHYLRDEMPEALKAFARLTRWDRRDADAYFHLAMCYRALGRRKPARRALRRCRAVDEEEKWAWEVAQELDRLKEKENR
jgi:hypothetical protein